jgi:hypothetical protein
LTWDLRRMAPEVIHRARAEVLAEIRSQREQR